jgi:hypothetical protein
LAPPAPRRLPRIACGLTAIAADVICIPMVLARTEASAGERGLALSPTIGLTGAAIPLAMVAFVIGAGCLPAPLGGNASPAARRGGERSVPPPALELVS